MLRKPDNLTRYRHEKLYSADMVRSLTYNSSPIVLAGLVYLVLLWPVVRLVSRMEHRLGG